MATKKSFDIPEDVSALDAEALEKSLAEAQDFLANITDESTDEELEAAEAVLGYVTSAQGEVQAREEAAQARADRIAAIKEAAKGAPKEEEEAPGAEAEAEVQGEAGGQEVVDEAERIAAEDAERERVAAAAKPKTFAITARAATKTPPAKDVPAPEKPKSLIAAAADVPGFSSGQRFGTFAEATEAIMRRLEVMPDHAPHGTHIRNGALLITPPKAEFAQDKTDPKGDVTNILFALAKENRLKGGSLTAAGGWGSPSEQSLSFCAPEGIDGLWSGPEFNVTRGGVSYTRGPSFSDVLGNSTGFWDMTEATAEAGVEQKTSLRPAIPTFTEKRLDAVGVMMEAGLLLRAGWPELVERYAALLLQAHQYKLNQKSLTQIRAFTGAATAMSNGFSNELDVLHFLELLIISERQREYLPETTTMEVLAPNWLKAAIRAGLAQRSGVDTVTVTDAQIEAHFTARGARVQWLRGFQDLTLTSGFPTRYPATAELIVYPAGTFVRGVAPVIQLDTIYDSVNLKKNDYVHLFVEQGVLMTNPCGTARRITVPMNINGRRAGITDAAVTAGQNDNFGVAPVANA